MASFLARALGLTEGAGLGLFPDAGPAHGESIDALAVAGITAGTSATTFSQSRQITRAQTATFLARALGWAAPTPPVATTLTVLPNNERDWAVLPRGAEGDRTSTRVNSTPYRAPRLQPTNYQKKQRNTLESITPT